MHLFLLWDNTIISVVCLINRLPTTALHNVVPFTALYLQT